MDQVRYRIVGKLGHGGMGVVYRAHDSLLRRQVALKFLPPEMAERPERRARFLREARTAASINHPSICTIHEVGELDQPLPLPPSVDPGSIPAGEPYISLEVIEGQSLRDLLEPGRPLPLARTLDLALQTVEGLAEAHRLHIVHRDLKPGNVMVTPEGRVKILDFGLAKVLDDPASPPAVSDLATRSPDLTREGQVAGTVANMSPEQARGEPVDARSDQFAFGIILYQMATGNRPFHGSTPIDTLSSILKEKQRSPSAVEPSVPPRLEEIVTRCLQKDPAGRYQDTRDLLADLRLLKEESGGAPRPKPARRGVLAWAAAALLAVAVLALYASGWIGSGPPPESEGPGTIRSLAVLPLDDLSQDETQEYFVDGMTEELIARMAQIQSIRVISRTSVMRYKKTSKLLPDIGRELGVDAVLEGSVRRSGGRIRLTAQLIEAATDRHLWAQSYERDLRDVLALQSDLARAVAEEIRIRITPRDEERLSRVRTLDPRAHEAYLKGRHHWNRRTQEAMTKAIEYFGEAVALDPSYAQAHVGLADAWSAQALYTNSREDFERARASARRALELDDSLAEPHASLARVQEVHDRDWAGAEASYRLAIDLNPGYSVAHHWYSLFAMSQSRPEQAIASARRALELDPLSLIINENLGDILYMAGRNTEAIQQLQRTLELDPAFSVAHGTLGRVFEEMGRNDEAVDQYLYGAPEAINSAFRKAYAAGGMKGYWRQAIEWTQAHGKPVPQRMALYHAKVGELDTAFDWLEKAFDQRSLAFTYLVSDPRYAPLRGDPRYADLLRRAGLDASLHRSDTRTR
ncbi:MAG: protein kinase domain-containing protein [Candidatus Polarisedimenticolia bacterium]